MSDGFELKLTLGNDAMRTADDVVRTLRAVAKRIANEGFGTGGYIHDDNGNKVGEWNVWIEDEDEDAEDDDA